MLTELALSALAFCAASTIGQQRSLKLDKTLFMLFKMFQK